MGRKLLYLIVMVSLFMSGCVREQGDRLVGGSPLSRPIGLNFDDEQLPENEYGIPFDGIMGLKGYYNIEYMEPNFSKRTYYADFGDTGKYLCIGESYGFDDPDDFSVDIDGDGVSELLCNCISGGSIHSELYVYKLTEQGVLKGHVAWSEDDLPGLVYWGSNAVQSRYDPLTWSIRIDYSATGSDTNTMKHFGFDKIEYENLGFIFLDEEETHWTVHAITN